MNTEWKPIESAPKDELILIGPTKRMGICVAMNHSRDGWVTETCNEWCSIYTPTRWMPLPAEPCLTCNGHGMIGGLTPHSGYDAEPCPDCSTPAPTSHPIPTGATGEEQDDSGMSPYCPECDGGGRISVLSDNSPDAHDVDIDCTHCGGSGSAADAAKNLARALQSERVQHLQIYGEYKNFHRSLCARFGYGHDPVHFRRDLVSLEEAIVAKVSAPAAGDARILPDATLAALVNKHGLHDLPIMQVYEFAKDLGAAIAQQKGEA